MLSILHEIMETDRSFHTILRFLDGSTRNHLAAAHMRNTNLALNILRQYAAAPPTRSMVINIPLTAADLSGNFFDPIPVVPSQQQIAAAVERHVGVSAETTCSICQEQVSCATRIRACGHSFHDSCIQQWFTMNPRCPMCRHDIRDLEPPRRQGSRNESDSMHSDEE